MLPPHNYMFSGIEKGCGLTYIEKDCGLAYIEKDCGLAYIEKDCGLAYIEKDCGLAYMVYKKFSEHKKVDCGRPYTVPVSLKRK